MSRTVNRRKRKRFDAHKSLMRLLGGSAKQQKMFKKLGGSANRRKNWGVQTRISGASSYTKHQKRRC